MVWVIIGVTWLVFTVIRYAPGDAATLIAMARYGGMDQVSEEEIAAIREKEQLDAPAWVQYWQWLTRVLHGDLGRSLVNGKPVSSEILRRFPATFQLALASMFVSLCLAVPIGTLSASRPNSLWDHLGTSGALIGVSMPNFWLGILLILLFSVHLDWLPVFGRGGVSHLILPALTLGTGMTALSTRLTRSSMLDALHHNYIRTAKAKGLPPRIILGKHALKNALVPIVTMIGLQFAYLLEGAVVVETIFAWPGIGGVLVTAIFARDYAMIQGCALFVAVVFSLANFLVDVCCAWFDPRIRYERRMG
jgi:peptide/nickel transport system permease protein